MYSTTVFGDCLFDVHQGNLDAKVIVHSPGFDNDEIPGTYLLRGEKDIPDWERIALSECFGKVLDVGSCSGAHSKILQAKGLNVHSLELDAKACAFQKEIQGIKKIHNVDFAEFTSNENFDCILLLMNGLGIAGYLQSVPSFINYCLSFLKKGGKLIFESCDIAYLFPDQDLSDSPYYGELSYQVSYNNQLSKEFPWLYLDAKTLKEMAVKQQWDLEILFEGEDDNYLAKITAK